MTTKPRGAPSGPKPKNGAHLAKVPAKAPGRARAPKLSKTVMAAIELLSTGRAQSTADAARQLGVTRPHLSRQLNKPHVRAWIMQNVKLEVAMSAGRAWSVKRSLLEAQSEHVQSDVASEILAMSGIQAPKAPAVAVQINNNNELPGYVIQLGPCAKCGQEVLYGTGRPPCACPEGYPSRARHGAVEPLGVSPQRLVAPDRPHVLIDGEVVVPRPQDARSGAAE